MHSTGTAQRGFTLIELSIVLVIIGLIVGGVLVGQDLIRAAEVRAQITQIEKYNTAVNTFRDKYGALPGDLNQQVASQFGFAARGQYAGEGDGNGIIEGNNENDVGPNWGANWGFLECAGETVMFWVDLSAVGLIEGSFNTAQSIPTGQAISSSQLSNYFPSAKLGGGNYIYVWSGGIGVSLAPTNGINYFGLSAVTSVSSCAGSGGEMSSNPGLTVLEAYAIDKKIDDGLPQTGRVTASYLNYASANYNAVWIGTSDTGATAGSATTCYDNGNVGGNPQQYSLEVNNGAGVNCALSLQFQ